MVKIRTKLLIYFSVIILIAIIFVLVQNYNSTRSFEYYDQSLESLFMKNEISQSTQETYDSLYLYILEPNEDNLINYQEKRQILIDSYEILPNIDIFNDELLLHSNYKNMLDSFLESADLTVDITIAGDVQAYSQQLAETEKISQFIHEMTLDLINLELTDKQEVFKLVENKRIALNRMSSAIALTILTLGVLTALSLSRGITLPIKRLNEAATEISDGRFTGSDVKISTKDELAFLTKTFNKMKHNIRQNLIEIEEKSQLTELLKESELRSLQNQINPHFLFNTLNTISKRAYIEGAEKTSDLITSVSTLLRYNLGNLDKNSLIKDEIHIVKEYFFIQKSRYGDKVTFETEIDESCLNEPIPRLTLQPIVENAFVHGIDEMTENAIVKLSVYQDDNYIYISVKDNGVGMAQTTKENIIGSFEQKEKSKLGEHSGHSTGIGLKNVISRLKILNKQNDLVIESELGKGTTITIKWSKKQE